MSKYKILYIPNGRYVYYSVNKKDVIFSSYKEANREISRIDLKYRI